MAPFQKHLRFIPGLLIVIASLLIGSVRGNAQPPSILLEPPVSNDENPLRAVFVDRDVDANGGLSSMAQTMPTTSNRIREATVRAGDTLGPATDFGFSSAIKLSRKKAIEKGRQTIPHDTHRPDGCHLYMMHPHREIYAFTHLQSRCSGQ